MLVPYYKYSIHTHTGMDELWDWAGQTNTYPTQALSERPDIGLTADEFSLYKTHIEAPTSWVQAHPTEAHVG